MKFLNNSNIWLEQLTIDANKISVIEDWAFDTLIFSTVHALTLNNLRVQLLTARTLVGFTSLVHVHLRLLTAPFVPDFLAPISSIIMYFEIEGPLSGQVHHLQFGGHVYPELVWVNFGMNLRDSLRATTFLGFGQVMLLELRKCQIEVIEQDTFHAVRERIVELDLRGNLLHQLPVGVFAFLLPQPYLIIRLKDNPFICDCRLMELQILLQMYGSKFDNDLVCASPRAQENKLIADSHFCGEPDSNAVLQVNCGYDRIEIALRSTLRPSVIRRKSELAIKMQSPQPLADVSNDTYFVQQIDMHTNQPKSQTDRHFQMCSFSLCRLVPAVDAHARLFMICLTSGSVDPQLTPKQCVSLMRSHIYTIWISTASKALALGIGGVLTSLTFVLGCGTGFLVLHRFPQWLSGGRLIKIVESNTYVNTVPDQSERRYG